MWLSRKSPGLGSAQSSRSGQTLRSTRRNVPHYVRSIFKTLAIHEYIHMPSCLTCNRFFFLEASLLKHIKLEHPPTAPQAIQDKSRTIILNCGTYSEAGETLKLPCPVVGCPRNSVCYKNLRHIFLSILLLYSCLYFLSFISKFFMIY